MTRTEIFSLARRIARECRDGIARAARFLRSLGIEIEAAIRALVMGVE